MGNDRNKKINRVTIEGSIVNMALLLFKFMAGILGCSAAMIADAVHSLSDFITDVIVLVFVNISSKPEDEDHDYGHGKYETLASSLIGLALLGVGIMIGYKAVSSIIFCFRGGLLEEPGLIAFIAAVVSIVSKEWIFRRTRRVGREVESQALEANAWHHRSDALSSIGTAVGIGGAIFLGQRWAVLDPIAAFVVSIFIILTSVKIIIPASEELLEKSLPHATEEKIRSIVAQDSFITDVHHLRTRKIGYKIAVEMHLRMPGDVSLSKAHSHVSSVEAKLKSEFGPETHIIIHFEPQKKS